MHYTWDHLGGRCLEGPSELPRRSHHEGPFAGFLQLGACLVLTEGWAHPFSGCAPLVLLPGGRCSVLRAKQGYWGLRDVTEPPSLPRNLSLALNGGHSPGRKLRRPEGRCQAGAGALKDLEDSGPLTVLLGWRSLWQRKEEPGRRRGGRFGASLSSPTEAFRRKVG